jgi:hypothetical protein
MTQPIKSQGSSCLLCFVSAVVFQLLDILKPRLIVTGHTHHGCHITHREDIHEWTLPSFSWRNKDNPSFMLVSITLGYEDC